MNRIKLSDIKWLLVLLCLPFVSSCKDDLEAYEEAEKQGGLFTDDASLIENFTSARVKLVENRVPNIKITYPEDLLFAEACRKQR